MEGRLTVNYIQGKWNIAGDILIFLSEHVLPGHFCGGSHRLSDFFDFLRSVEVYVIQNSFRTIEVMK